MGIPVVIGGILVVHGGGLLSTARDYGIAVIVLAALAVAGLSRRTRTAPSTDTTDREPELAARR